MMIMMMILLLFLLLGGPLLRRHRADLPLVTKNGKRCLTGNAVLTGPGEYGKLNVPHVIHAVGPNYIMCSSLEKGDVALRNAYENTMKTAQTVCLDTIGFSLLSSGIFRGRQNLGTVLEIGVRAVIDTLYPELKFVAFVGYLDSEIEELIYACERIFSSVEKTSVDETGDVVVENIQAEIASPDESMQKITGAIPTRGDDMNTSSKRERLQLSFSNMGRKCLGCNTQGAAKMRCAVCKVAMYCNKQCQRKVHKHAFKGLIIFDSTLMSYFPFFIALEGWP